MADRIPRDRQIHRNQLRMMLGITAAATLWTWMAREKTEAAIDATWGFLGTTSENHAVSEHEYSIKIIDHNRRQRPYWSGRSWFARC